MAKLTDKQRQQVVIEYANGATQQQIARMFGVSDVAISKILRKGENSEKLEKLKTELSTELEADFETFMRSRAGKTSEIIILSQDMVIEKLKSGKITPKEAIGACKVFSEMVLNVPKNDGVYLTRDQIENTATIVEAIKQFKEEDDE